IGGVPTYKAYTNLRGYDLLATSIRGNKSARIQVKSRWATDANSFSIKKDIDCEFVVLVGLNRGYDFSGVGKRVLPADDPEYYVRAASEANALVVEGGSLEQNSFSQGRLRISPESMGLHLKISRWGLIENISKSVNTRARHNK
ncbi:MAG: hypothetical protein WAV18_08240, partial [Roseiarcus sp.]